MEIFDIASNMLSLSCDPPNEALEDINFAMNRLLLVQRDLHYDYNWHGFFGRWVTLTRTGLMANFNPTGSTVTHKLWRTIIDSWH
jgi:hypothetical protein